MVVAATLFAGLGTVSASALPINNLGTIELGTEAQDIRWVCGPYRCWWRPNYYYGGYGYYGGPRYYRGWGGYGYRGGYYRGYGGYRGGWRGGRRW